MKRKVILTIAVLLVVVLAGLFFRMFLLYRYEVIATPGLQSPIVAVRINRITSVVSMWSMNTKWVVFDFKETVVNR
jgi:hypothetical protein